MADFKTLRVARKAHDLALALYEVTRNFPSQERFGLTSQLRRAAVSVGANIAEGCGRRSPRELVRFADIASGSAHEIEFLLSLSHDLGWVSEEDWARLRAEVTDIQRMLSGLKRVMRREANG